MRIYARPIPDAKNAHKVKNDQGVVHVALLSACVIHVHYNGAVYLDASITLTSNIQCF